MASQKPIKTKTYIYLWLYVIVDEFSFQSAIQSKSENVGMKKYTKEFSGLMK